MTDVIRPSSEAELPDAIMAATGPFEIVGTATKRLIGRPVQAAATLDLSGLSDIAVYEPEELILEAGAGARLQDIEALLDATGQQLAFEPPDLSRLLGTAHGGTLGGMVACNLAGPRRIRAGAARDHILGVRAVSGRGEVFKAGARVVKNVTGYDLPKLMCASYGTLAVMTAVTLKVLPKPETEETIIIDGLDDATAVAVMSAAMQSQAEVAGAAFIPGEAVYLRLEGISPSVIARRDGLAKLLGRPVQILAASSSKARWQAIRDVLPLADGQDRHVWRLSVTPSEAPAIVARLKESLDLRYYLDWAGGLIWLDVPPRPDASAALIRQAMPSGHATLIRAPEDVRASVEVFQPQDAALAALSARVKAAFDPGRLLNPGRMYQGI